MSVWEGVDKDGVNSKQQEDRELHKWKENNDNNTHTIDAGVTNTKLNYFLLFF